MNITNYTSTNCNSQHDTLECTYSLSSSWYVDELGGEFYIPAQQDLTLIHATPHIFNDDTYGVIPPAFHQDSPQCYISADVGDIDIISQVTRRFGHNNNDNNMSSEMSDDDLDNNDDEADDHDEFYTEAIRSRDLKQKRRTKL
eukprot:UN04654